MSLPPERAKIKKNKTTDEISYRNEWIIIRRAVMEGKTTCENIFTHLHLSFYFCCELRNVHFCWMWATDKKFCFMNRITDMFIYHMAEKEKKQTSMALDGWSISPIQSNKTENGSIAMKNTSRLPFCCSWRTSGTCTHRAAWLPTNRK